MAVRILHLVATPGRRGTLGQMSLLCPGLVAHGTEIHVCALASRGSTAELELGGPLSILRRRWQIDIPALLQLRRKLAEFKPHVLHTWCPTTNFYGCLAVPRNGQTRIVATRRQAMHRRVFLNKYLAGRTDRILVGSPSVATAWDGTRGHYADKYRVIPAAIADRKPAATTRNDLLREIGLPSDEDAMVIGTVSSLRPEKRLKDLIWALDLLRVIYPNPHLVVLGEGEHRWELERYRDQCRLRGHVHFLGFRHDLPELLPHLDCLWHASGEGGTPNSILEAMAAGIPVVTTSAPGHYDLVIEGETGFVVPVGDRAGFARKTNRLLEDRSLAKTLGNAGRARFNRRCSISDMVQQHIGIYQELATNDFLNTDSSTRPMLR